jgi:hypothetical protein
MKVGSRLVDGMVEVGTGERNFLGLHHELCPTAPIRRNNSDPPNATALA